MEEKIEHHETDFAMLHLAHYLHLLQKKKKY